MENNSYSASETSLSVDSTARIVVYSPAQVAIGAFVGGPVGLTYFLMANFGALYNDRARKNTLYSGISLIIALLCILPMLPDNFPSLPLTILYVVAARMVSEKYQLTKSQIAESEQCQFQSNWKVFGLSLLCFIGSTVAIVIPLAVLSMLGITAV